MPSATSKIVSWDERPRFIPIWPSPLVSIWPNGFAFVLSFLSPLWTVGKCACGLHVFQVIIQLLGAFDASTHISEEASNARYAISTCNYLHSLTFFTYKLRGRCRSLSQGVILIRPSTGSVRHHYFTSHCNHPWLGCVCWIIFTFWNPSEIYLI